MPETTVAEPVRWGVLSTASIARTALIPALHASTTSQVRAVGSRNLDAARAFAIEMDIPVAYGSYEELLADPEIEAIYNPLPNHLHVPWTIKAMRAGKHVLCEKPISLHLADLETLLAATREHPELVVMEAFMYRFHPRWIEAKRLVDSGAIGAVKDIDVSFSYFNRDPQDVRNQAGIGGGALMDIGCYCISVARFLYGAEPGRVVSTLDIDPDFGTDRHARAILDFGEGRVSRFFCSTQAENLQHVRVVGQKGIITMELPFNPPRDVSLTLGVTIEGERRDSVVPAVDHYREQADAFSRAVRAGGPAPTPLADARANMAVIEAVVASDRDGGWVGVS
jgi:predicted dehydrogenase